MSKYDPDHYQLGKIQVWDFIVDQDLTFLEGNIIKYLCRAGNKPHESKLDDLLKAKAYLDKLIATTNDNTLSGPSRSSSDLPQIHGATHCDEGCECPLHAAPFDR